MNFSEKQLLSENQEGNFEMIEYHPILEDFGNIIYKDSENLQCNSKGYKNEETRQGCKLDTEDYLKNMNDFSSQALESLKNFRGYISNVAQSTNRSISKTAQHFKSVIAKNNFLDNSTDTKNNRKEATSEEEVKAPWIGTIDEEETKKQILSLSESRKMFLRKPPEGVFEFNLDDYIPVAKLLLKKDNRLQKMRFELVPKLIKEENFWKNYFYRINLIKQSFNISHSNFKFNSSKLEEFNLQENPDDLGENANVKIHDSFDKASIGIMRSEKDLKANEITPQKDDSFETEIQELNSSLYLVDINEELGDKDWEKELEQMLQESY